MEVEEVGSGVEVDSVTSRSVVKLVSVALSISGISASY